MTKFIINIVGLLLMILTSYLIYKGIEVPDYLVFIDIVALVLISLNMSDK